MSNRVSDGPHHAKTRKNGCEGAAERYGIVFGQLAQLKMGRNDIRDWLVPSELAVCCLITLRQCIFSLKWLVSGGFLRRIFGQLFMRVL